MSAAAAKTTLRGLDKFVEKFEKSFGAGTIQRTKSANPYEVLSTGSLSLDYALGVGGYVEGRIVEIWGPEGVGKTTLSMMAVAEAQRKHPEKNTAWIDMEQVWDDNWAEQHGIDLERNLLFRPNSAEDVADAVKEFLSSGLFSVVVLDSVGAMIPEKEKEKDADEATVAIQAKIVTRMVKIAAVAAREHHCTFIIINQVRAQISFRGGTTTGGGFALKHASSFKLKLARTGTTPFKAKIEGEDRTVGHEIKVKVERNKVAPAYREATMVLFNQPSKYGPVGIDRVDEAVTLGIKTGVIRSAGAWYDVPGLPDRVNGREAIVRALRDNPEATEAIRAEVLRTREHEIVLDELDDEDAPMVTADGEIVEA